METRSDKIRRFDLMPNGGRSTHRIVSLLPSATEIACALGLEDELVGITHCCDYPKEKIEGKAVVVRSALPIDRMTMSEIDRAVAERLRDGESLYLLNEELLRELEPTLLLTQDLCQVCAPAGNEISRALGALATKPQVIWMAPHSLTDIQSDIIVLGGVTDRLQEADAVVSRMRERLQEVRRVCASVERPSVFCAEWLDPLYCAGHWVPEMVEVAGGREVLGKKWKDSVRVSWESVREAAPEVILVMACGMSCAEALESVGWLRAQPGFSELPAVRDERVFAVDASYFSKPGPRVVDGVELLAHLLQPERCEWRGTADAFAAVDCGVA